MRDFFERYRPAWLRAGEGNGGEVHSATAPLRQPLKPVAGGIATLIHRNEVHAQAKIYASVFKIRVPFEYYVPPVVVANFTEQQGRNPNIAECHSELVSFLGTTWAMATQYLDDALRLNFVSRAEGEGRDVIFLLAEQRKAVAELEAQLLALRRRINKSLNLLERKGRS